MGLSAGEVGARCRVPLVLLVFSVGATGCSGIRTQIDRDGAVDLTEFETYAWRTAAHPSDTLLLDDSLEAQVRRIVDAHLEQRGLRQASADQADLLVTPEIRVEVKLQLNDPYYAFYTAVKYEVGTIQLDLVDAGTGEPVWRGSARCRLRTVAHALGVNHRRFVNRSEQRVWPVEELVGAILEELPPLMTSVPGITRRS